MKRILFTMVCISFAVAGCASNGHDFSLDTVRSLAASQSTMSQVRLAMGDPESIDNKDGNTIWKYSYGQYTSAFPVPEGSTNSSKVASFIFSGEKLTDASWGFFSMVYTKAEDGGLEWGKPVDWAKMQSLPLNTTPSQVEQQFGPPTGRDFDRNAHTTSMLYTWSRVNRKAKAANLLFKDEKLISVKIAP